jgi:hypothetical protein
MINRVEQLSVHIRASPSVSRLGVHDGLSAKVNEEEEREAKNETCSLLAASSSCLSHRPTKLLVVVVKRRQGVD